MPKVQRTVIICVIAEVLNFLTGVLFFHVLKIPLFFDTIFIVAVVFYCGFIPALCVSLGYSLINTLFWTCKNGVLDPFIFLYSICGVLIVISTWLIARMRYHFKISSAITVLYLFLIVLISSFCSTIAGGIIDYFHYIFYDVSAMMSPIKTFTDSFVQQHFSLLASCILAQIPISFADRFIATFAGYGIYRLADIFIDKRLL